MSSADAGITRSAAAEARRRWAPAREARPAKGRPSRDLDLDLDLYPGFLQSLRIALANSPRRRDCDRDRGIGWETGAR